MCDQIFGFVNILIDLSNIYINFLVLKFKEKICNALVHVKYDLENDNLKC